MEDARIWEFEHSLWTGDAEHYRSLIDDECVMILPSQPHVVTGTDAIDAVANTPRWDKAELTDRSVVRPQEGLIVIGYHAEASRGDGDSYKAWCSSTLRWIAHDEWRVVQHSQSITPALVAE